MNTIKLSLDMLEDVFFKKLVAHGVDEGESRCISAIFVKNAADGIMTHSVERFPRLVAQIDAGIVRPGVKPTLVSSFCALERYDAGYGVGTTCASFSMKRAVELAEQYGVGIVALRYANHWMRAGYYALLAADEGKIGICWTNTMQNLASWGSREANIGNNPVAIAVPKEDGRHYVLDSAMSQFSVGKVSQYADEDKRLPVPGGYDTLGCLTDDPKEILLSWRFLPSGYWKGSGFSILFDCIGAMLSNGQTVAEVGHGDALHEAGLSQVFISIDPNKLGPDASKRVMASIEGSLSSAKPIETSSPVRYPGENMKTKREKAEKDGVVVSEEIWNTILGL